MKADGTIVIDTAIQNDGFQAGTKELEAAARGMASKVNALGNKLKISITKQAESFSKLNDAYAQQEQKVDSLRQKLQELSNQKINTEGYQKLEDELRALENEFEKAEQKQREWLSMGFSPDDVNFGKISKELDNIFSEMEKVQERQKQMRDAGQAYIDPASTEAYRNTVTRITAEESKLNEMNRKLNISYAALKNRFDEYSKSSVSIRKITNQVSNALKNLTKTVSNAGKKVKTLVVEVLKAFKAFGKFILGVRKSDKHMQMSMGRMLAMSIMFSAVFSLISAVTGGIGEGMQNLAQYSDETNQSISTLMSSLTRLKNSFATAFAPILQVVTPALTTFINMVSQAVTYVGMLIAALTGQDSFVRAVGVQEDYAGSLEDTAGAAQDAEKALNGYISPLDKINRYEDGRNGSGSGSSIPGHVAPTPDEMFETVPIESSIKGIADKIKKLIQAQDWEGLGDYIASGINKGLQKVYNVINWDNVGPKITAFVDAFTGTFNSLVDNLNWDLIGRTIGAGVNTLVNTLNRLIEGIDWTNLGSKVAAGIYGLFNEIDWTNLGNLIGNKFMILWNFLYGLVTDLDWGQVGTSVGNAINGAFEKINFKTIGSTLARIFNGAVEFLKNATKTIKWKEIADNVASGINKALEEINPAEAGKALSDFVTSLLGMLLDIVRQTDWAEVGRSIGEFLGSIDWGKIISQVGQIIWEAFSGILAGLFDTGSGKVIIGFIAGLKGIELAFKAVNLAVTASKWVSSIAPAFSSLVSAAGGLVSSIGSALAPLASVIFSPQGAIVAALVAMVGIIVLNFDKVKEAASDLKNWVTKKFNEAKEAAGNIWKSISTNVSKFFNTITSNAKKMSNDVKNFVAKKFNEAKSAAGNIWNGIKSSLSNIWNGIKSTASNTFNSIKTNIGNAWNNLKTTTSSIWSNIKSSLSSTWNGLKTTASSAFNNVKTVVSSAWNGIRTTSASAWNGISKTLTSIWSRITGTARNAFSGIKNVVTNAWNGVKSVTTSIWNGIYNTVSSIWSRIKSALSGIGSRIKSTFSGSSISSRSISLQTANVLSNKPIPYLATGAVIPPNAPFVAVLGDQKTGSNIEAPESLLRKIVREESGRNNNKGGNYRFTAQINRRTLFDEMINEAKMRRIQTGNNPFEMI